MATCIASFTLSVVGSTIDATISISSESVSVYEAGISTPSSRVYRAAGAVGFTYMRGNPLAHAFSVSGVMGSFVPNHPVGNTNDIGTATMAWEETITVSTTFSGIITIHQA